jgi:metal-responsive CopG/Arc/MetJ family transcriptional regulator
VHRTEVPVVRVVQMTLEEELIASVDAAARRLRTTRSAFTRAALRAALRQLETKQLERRHRQGYERHPPSRSEFAVWEKEQAWGDE